MKRPDLITKNGDTRDWTLTLSDTNNAALDLTDCRVQFTMRRHKWHIDNLFVRDTAGAGSSYIEIAADPTTGVITISPTADDWTGLSDASGVFVGEVKVSDQTNTNNQYTNDILVRVDGTQCASASYVSPSYKHWFFYGNSYTVANSDVVAMALIDTAKAAGYTGFMCVMSYWSRYYQWEDNAAWMARMTNVRQYCADQGMEFIISIQPKTYIDNLPNDANADVLAEGYPATAMRFIVQGDGTIIADPDDLDTRFATDAAPPATATTIEHDDYAYWIKATAPTANTYVHAHFQIKYSADYVGSGARLSCIGRKTGAAAAYTFQKVLANTGTDWTDVDVTFSTQDCDVSIYFYISANATAGSIEFQNLEFTPGGIMNVLRRANTPFVMTSEDGLTTYEEGTDFTDAEDANIRDETQWRSASVPVMSKVGGALSENDVVLCSYCHAGFYYDSWYPCMSDPAFRSRMEECVQGLITQFAPDTYFLWLDEIRFMGWDPACVAKGTLGEALADYATFLTELIETLDPNKPVWIWSDMFDPWVNASPNHYPYQLPDAFTGSWEGLSSDVGIMNWNAETALVDVNNETDAGGTERYKRSFDFFHGRGHQQIYAGYYDSAVYVTRDKPIIAFAQDYGYAGVMYSTWKGDYSKLQEYLTFAKANES